MSIINQKTGYYGITMLDPSSDVGHADSCLFTIVYDYRTSGVNFTISSGADDWAAVMPNGEICDLTNPEVLYHNQDNSIVKFSLESNAYSGNTPCYLVYKSDTAWFNILESDGSAIVPNTISGHLAYTTRSYGATVDSNGQVNKLIATIPFPNASGAKMVFTMSTSAGHWGAHMPDGSIIDLVNPSIVVTNQDNAVIEFTMNESYPSNTPALLVYVSTSAWINIKADSDTSYPLIDTTDIVIYHDSMYSGTDIDLSNSDVLPYNSSFRGVVWEVQSGPASINGNILSSTDTGTIKLKGTVVKGSNSGTDNFSKEFTITSTKNVITLNTQSDEILRDVSTRITGKLFVNVDRIHGDVYFQWYSSTTNSSTGAVIINGATNTSYDIPSDISDGTYYYYCKITSPGASDVYSRIFTVIITPPLTGITISPDISTMGVGGLQQFTAVPVPSIAVLPYVNWHSSSQECIQIDENGSAKVIYEGSSTITLTTDDGEFSTSKLINITPHVPVSSIVINNEFGIDIDNNIDFTISPSDATNKTVSWVVTNANGTGAKIVDGIFTATTVGTCTITATITNGSSPYQDYTQSFAVQVKYIFIPVSDIELDVSVIYAAEGFKLEPTISPANSSYRTVNFEITAAGTTGATLNDDILHATSSGTLSLKMSVVNGTAEGTDYSKTISVNVLPEFIPVDLVSGIQERIEDVTESITLSATVEPSNATNQTIEYSIVNNPEVPAYIENGKLYIEYDKVSWWVENPNPTPPDYYDTWMEGIEDASVYVKVTVKNGLTRDTDFEATVGIGLAFPESPTIHIELDDIEVILPSINRAMRPIVLNKIQKDPWNASANSILAEFFRKGTRYGGFGFNIRPTDYDEEYLTGTMGLELSDEYDWTINSYYAIIFENVVTDAYLTALNANSDGSSKEFVKEVEFLPEYIPVSEINNVTTKAVAGVYTQINYGLSVDYNVTDTSSQPYDVDNPTYTDATYRVVDAGDTGATITESGLLYPTSTGTVRIEVSIPQGTSECFTWYTIENPGAPFVDEFDVVVSAGITSTTVTGITSTLPSTGSIGDTIAISGSIVPSGTGKSLEWDIIDAGGTGASITGSNISNITSTGVIVVRASAVDSIIMKVSLQGGEVVYVTTYNDVRNLCNQLSSESLIYVNNDPFRKDQVVEIEFVNFTASEVDYSLNDFARNFINLTTINTIPSGVRYMNNFLYGCESLTSSVNIPSGVLSMNCFMKGCRSFNQPISIPSGVSSMNNFLYGCTSFNQSVSIPSGVTGEKCLWNFLYGCTSFNQSVSIPSGVTGDRCMDGFLQNCHSFNQNLVIPSSVSGTAALRGMLSNAYNMTSSIEVPSAVASACASNGLALAMFEECNACTTGITITGTGATTFKSKFNNVTELIPFRKLI